MFEVLTRTPQSSAALNGTTAAKLYALEINIRLTTPTEAIFGAKSLFRRDKLVGGGRKKGRKTRNKERWTKEKKEPSQVQDRRHVRSWVCPP